MNVQAERLVFDASGRPIASVTATSMRVARVRSVRRATSSSRATGCRNGGAVATSSSCSKPVSVSARTSWRPGSSGATMSDAARRLHFVSIERHPLAAVDLIAAAPAELRILAQQFAARWPLPMPGLHRREFEAGGILLTLAFGDARVIARRLKVGADAIYLDGFAPDRNPEMWEASVLKAIARCARTDATLATWTTARAVRDALATCGFVLETRPGFGHKREMLAGRYAPAWKVRRHEPPVAYRGERSALVIGAGIAGIACAEAMARRGWSVRVIDRAARPASAGSSLPAGSAAPRAGGRRCPPRAPRAGRRRTVAGDARAGGAGRSP